MLLIINISMALFLGRFFARDDSCFSVDFLAREVVGYLFAPDFATEPDDKTRKAEPRFPGSLAE